MTTRERRTSKSEGRIAEVCFACLAKRTEPNAGATWFDLIGLATIFDELKLPMGSIPNVRTFKEGAIGAGKAGR